MNRILTRRDMLKGLIAAPFVGGLQLGEAQAAAASLPVTQVPFRITEAPHLYHCSINIGEGRATIFRGFHPEVDVRCSAHNKERDSLCVLRDGHIDHFEIGNDLIIKPTIHPEDAGEERLLVTDEPQFFAYVKGHALLYTICTGTEARGRSHAAWLHKTHGKPGTLHMNDLDGRKYTAFHWRAAPTKS